ncbi:MULTISPECIES: hypothetical protein [Frankia]|uniref:hypothetical protein n=1 Tax=Frankia TaxID=1854 RepID=UPI000460DB80|nr:MULTISPECIES: hypothetical protein [Frankia]KDA41083.1 hypothetical protein BMG523Draft_04091 [Frankia sp. BMG5.23]ORT92800.1 hypothetical protein UK99_21280 [Frankia casuarinae]ORT93099.1 hypothetical protein UK99_20435 [Frankia casuarinae]
MVDPSRLPRPADTDSYDGPPTADKPPRTGTADPGRDSATAARDGDGPTPLSPADAQDARDAEADRTDPGPVARWLAETLAEAPPVPPAAAALIAGVLVRRPPAA